MSFLDSLEDNIKALEGREEKDPEKIRREQERREADRTEAILRAPHIEALKNSAFTSDFLTQCRIIGHGQRVLVRFTWIGESLRLDAQTKRLELTPTKEGIAAVFFSEGAEVRRVRVDPAADDPASLARDWLTPHVASNT